jgi:predicted nucleotidyltransferase component of viral defense system
MLTYPTDFKQISGWANENHLTIVETRFRFAQFAMLSAVAGSGVLGRSVVFKGGNALDFIWLPNRSTLDLDFSVDAKGDPFELSEAEIEKWLQLGLNQIESRLEIVARINSIRRQPPGDGKTFVTYATRIGYALPDQARLQIRLRGGEKSPQVIAVEISINEPVCGSTEVLLDGFDSPLRISTIEDIVAEKLRALLQQPIRNRSRQQDLLDIALIVRERGDLDSSQVARYLLRKSASRDVTVSKAAFHDPEIANRAMRGYNDLAKTTRRVFIPFDKALATLLGFVDQLEIPER